MSGSQEASSRVPKRTSLPGRCLDVIFSPDKVWLEIKSERRSVGGIYTGFLLPMMLIGPLALFVRRCFLGFQVPLTGAIVTIPISQGLYQFSVQLSSFLILPFLVAIIVKKAASRFEGNVDFPSAFRLVTYSCVPAYLSGLFLCLPDEYLPFGMALGGYSIIVYHHGIARLTTVPQESRMEFFLVTIGLAFLIFLAVWCMMAMFLPQR